MCAKKTSGADAGNTRRRARRACIACHERKVRCNVLQQHPCSNCVEDRVVCIIRNHKNRRGSVRALELGSETQAQNYQHHQASQSEPQRQAQSSQREYFMSPGNQSSDLQTRKDNSIGYDNRSSVTRSDVQNQQPAIPQTPVGQYDPLMAAMLWPMADVGFGMHDSSLAMGGSRQVPGEFDLLADSDLTAPMGMESAFSNAANFNGAAVQDTPGASGWQDPSVEYMTLPVENISERTWEHSEEHQEDLQYLKSRGCFQLPPPQVLFRLMQSYFQFVHPNLPLVDEGDVWKLWSVFNDYEFNIGNFSLLLLQSMAFTAISFVSDDVVRLCGFDSARKARLTFYRRAKALFDTEFENSSIHMAQSALLLSYYASSTNTFRLNTQWLSHGIRYSRLVQADRFYEFPSDDPKTRSTLKRLWWCCIMRDRILPLGLRRPIQIASVPAELGEDRFLSEDDFANELGLSRVHNQATQAQVFRIINLSCRLAEALTPALSTVLSVEKPRDRARATTIDNLHASLDSAKAHIDALYGWHDLAIRLFPPPVSIGDEDVSVVIFSNLLFIYFDAAILSLCHHVMVLWETRPVEPSQSTRNFETPVAEIVRALGDTTERTKELLQQGLGGHLPISLSAYLTLPFILHVLEVKAATGELTEAVARRKLSIYSKALRMQQKLYDGTDFIWNLVENMQKYSEEVNMDHKRDSTESEEDSERRSNVTDKQVTTGRAGRSRYWNLTTGLVDLLVRKPRRYLRLVMHVDVALCEGVPPQEKDFPEALRRESVYAQANTE